MKWLPKWRCEDEQCDVVEGVEDVRMKKELLL